ncbi:MAG: hypothetical protein HQ481_05635 [Alphaproteobacteria bacterium]|nr:hypothetical protein [Alphaproteobacteria bacterium]
MKSSHIRNLLGTVAMVSMLASTPAFSTEYRLVWPERYAGDGEALNTAAWQVFANIVGPGDTFSVWDGTNNKRIAKIAVPDDERYAVLKRKMRKFAREIAQIGAFLKDRASPGSSASGSLDLLLVLRGLGDNRIEANEDIHVLLIGAPLQVTRDPAWSMISEDGELQVPTDAAMFSRAYRTPYSVEGRANALARSFVHMCTLGRPKLDRLQDMALRHVWGRWTAAQGGTLATWADDLSVCVERLTARVTQPVETGAPDSSLPPAMVRPAWNASEHDDDGEDNGTERVQPDVFNVFFKAVHPRMRGLIVYTGVEYAPANYPARYNNAWCYFNSAAGRDGVQVRVNVGDMEPGDEPVWHTPSKRELEAAGVSREDFALARSVCRFPAHGG